MQVRSYSRAAERRGERKQQIVETASELFSARGYENVTLRAIAEKLGYAHAALYRYFPDKGALLAEICRQTFGHLTMELDAQESRAEGPESRLLAVSLGFVRFGLAHPHHYQVVFSNPLSHGSVSRETLEAIGRPFYARLMQAFLDCAEALEMNADSRILDANTWWISLFGTTHVLIHSCAVIGPASSDEVVQRHVEVMWKGFRALASTKAATSPAASSALSRRKPARK